MSGTRPSGRQFRHNGWVSSPHTSGCRPEPDSTARQSNRPSYTTPWTWLSAWNGRAAKMGRSRPEDGEPAPMPGQRRGPEAGATSGRAGRGRAEMRSVFVGTPGYLARIDGPTRCAFWAQDPEEHDFD